MGRILIWGLAGIASVVITMAIFLPATWMATMIEQQTDGRLTLGDAQGTLWHGSAFIGGAAGENAPLTPLLPGRFSWRFSPMVLLGSVEIDLENPAALLKPIKISGSWKQWQVSPGAVSLPAERLSALGAPLNTVQPSGLMRLSWEQLSLSKKPGSIEMTGKVQLEINELSSRISPVRPLGSYNLALDWHGAQASIQLSTVKGPMILSGSGTIADGRVQFSGQAEAEAGQEERLENFLNLLGQKRKIGNKTVIAFKFR